LLCWETNVNSTISLFEFIRKYNPNIKIIIPSSIGAFGSNTDKMAPQDTCMQPSTMYGISKVTCELLSQYYNKKYNMDIRGLRLPGVISYEAMPGGGTTDYAVDIFYNALIHKKYTCFLSKDTRLPMMYMPDCINALILLTECDKKQLKRQCDFNISSLSFTPHELYQCICKHIPDFTIQYKPDFRQAIADSWPHDMNDTEARQQWNWKPLYTLDGMVDDMIHKLKQRKIKTGNYYPINDDVSSKL